MNNLPSDLVPGVAGSAPSLTAAADWSRTRQLALEQARRTAAENQARQAAGVGETAAGGRPDQRDADGRRFGWTVSAVPRPVRGDQEVSSAPFSHACSSWAEEPWGETPAADQLPQGTRLDLCG